MSQTVKVGDVFERSWGYDQTNVDFYEVVSVSASGKTGKARRVKSVHVSATAVTAATGADRFVEDARCAKCSNHHRNAAGERDKTAAGWDGHAYRDTYTYRAKTDSVVVDGSYGDHAYRWDGSTRYQTAYGYGH